MSNLAPRQLIPYGIAILAVLLALILMLVLNDKLAMSQSPFLLFFGAVVVSAWYGGLKPGFVATLFSVFLSGYFFISPAYQWIVPAQEVIRVSLFFCQGIVISLLSEALHKARKRTETSLHKLKQSENRFRLALRSSNLTIFQQDYSLRYQWIHNSAGLVLSEHIIGKSDYDIFPLCDAEKLLAIKSLVLESGIAAREEISLFTGETIQDYDLIIEPIKKENQIIGVTGVAVNITERKQTETQLKTANQRVTEILETITDSFFAVDNEWRFTYLNQRFEQESGYSRQELLGKSLWEQFPNTINSIFYERYHQAKAEGIPVTVEGTVPDGSERWFLAHAYPSHEGLAVYFQEISDRKHTEKALQKTQERLKLALNAAKMMVWDANLKTHEVVCSETALEIWGFQTGTRDEFINKIYPDDREKVLQTFSQSIQDKTLYSIEYRMINPQEEIRWLRSQGMVYFNDSGEPENFIGVSFDITQRKKMEEAIRQSEERFRAMFNQAAVGIAQVALDGQFIEINPALCEITGYSHEDLSKMTFQDITYPPDLELDWAYAEKVLAKEIPGYSLEKRYIRKDGSISWVNLTSSAVWDHETGQPKYAVGIIEDINARKKVEESQKFLLEASRVLASSLNLEATLYQLAELAVPTLADWCIVDLVTENWTLQELACISINSEKQKLLSEMRRRYPPSFEQHHPFVQELRRGQTLFYSKFPESMLAKMARNDEHLKILIQLNCKSLMVIPIVSRGQVFGALSFAYSESGRFYQEADLNLAEDLARRAAMAIDNSRLYREAEKANRMKDEFLAILSHELRTPLNPIVGWSRLLRTRNYDQATQQKALEIIERNSKLQAQLIEDLLDVSQILQGKLNFKISPVNLVNIIESAIETMRLAAQAKLINLNFVHIPPEWAGSSSDLISPQFIVSGDAGRLQQIIWNLLSNAVKFTPKKGNITVELSLSGSLNSPEGTQDSYAQIRVIDTGKGITSDFLPYVFDYFRQADGGITRQHGGLGLGLAIVRHLVELHGGTVHAESPGDNQGATFTVKLPLFKPKAFNQQLLGSLGSDAGDARSQFSLQGTRILVVDDEQDTRDIIAFVLQEQGAMVQVAPSAIKALQLFSKFKPNFCIFDIGMPVIDGYMLMRQIRKMPPAQGGETPAIALTAYATEADQEKAFKAGFQRHLAKPIEPDELVKAVVELLHKQS